MQGSTRLVRAGLLAYLAQTGSIVRFRTNCEVAVRRGVSSHDSGDVLLLYCGHLAYHSDRVALLINARPRATGGDSNLASG